MKRSRKLIDFLNGLQTEQPSFEDIDFSDIRACNDEGENALHFAVIRKEYEISKELIEHGIEINARGDLGHTPLHEAASMADLSFVKLLVENGADVHALNEGVPAFTLARYAKKDDVCDYLSNAMKGAQEKDRTVWYKAHIKYLEREIERLKKLCNEKNL